MVEDSVIRIFRIAADDGKNYLTEPEIEGLERIASMYLDYAENQAKRQIPIAMKDWVSKLDAFLQFNEYDVLQDAGKVSATLNNSAESFCLFP